MRKDEERPGESRASDPAWAIELERVARRFGEVSALDQVSLAVRSGEFFSLLGPSGCGKTTLLRLIAGLDLPDAGSVWIGGRDMARIPPHRRPVNTVFQSYALFPHLDVWHNIAFGLRMKGVPRAEQAERVGRIMEMVQVSNLARRKPHQLSGGQRQRVALARAIVNEPQVLLLDEPLGALDLKLRQQLQSELHDLQKRLGITFLYVTHDQDEALSMSDRIAVMNHGHIVQVGDSESIYESPRTRFVAQFLGSCNLIDGTIDGREGEAIVVRTAVGPLRLTSHPAASPPVPGQRCTLAVRPEKVSLAPRNGHLAANTLHAVVRDQVYSGAETQYLLSAADWSFRVCALNAGLNGRKYPPGSPVSALLPPESLIVLED
ncbi:MAG TPA: ABC transporter ATP-binding protein [Candidatus Paceibacterota bacterium]|nr:ABC transporter ATP-binding protein [Verrucomicrobiota bacterium]HRY48933.1 ABC transporter ATP-binding protein [Candidatus Paceibacterota bacterium]HSA02838.1 ABC transporter ATP-binding protein [Candidatus Paceibacterota bacterium]